MSRVWEYLGHLEDNLPLFQVISDAWCLVVGFLGWCRWSPLTDFFDESCIICPWLNMLLSGYKRANNSRSWHGKMKTMRPIVVTIFLLLLLCYLVVIIFLPNFGMVQIKLCLLFYWLLSHSLFFSLINFLLCSCHFFFFLFYNKCFFLLCAFFICLWKLYFSDSDKLFRTVLEKYRYKVIISLRDNILIQISPLWK